MTEAELKSRLRSALPDAVPEQTHAVYMRSLMDVKKRKGRMQRLRLVPVLAFVLVLLAAATAVAVNYYSVTQFPQGDKETFLQHVITLNQHYSNEVLDMSVNDLVFDGQNISVAMDIRRKDTNSGYYMSVDLSAVDENGRVYTVDVESWVGGDFMGGFYYPDFWENDQEWSEEDGFGFDGVVWDEDMNPPPDGAQLNWTMRFTVLKPVWPMNVLARDDYNEIDWQDVMDMMTQAWQEQTILYSSGLVEYAYAATEAMGLNPSEMHKTEMLVASGAFEQVDSIVCQFVTDAQENVQHPELTGTRYSLGDYALVLDRVDVSFQRVQVEMHYDLGRTITEEELEQLGLPDCWAMQINDGKIDVGSRSWGIEDGVWQQKMDAYLEETAKVLTLIPGYKNKESHSYTYDEESAIRIELTP